MSVVQTGAVQDLLDFVLLFCRLSSFGYFQIEVLQNLSAEETKRTNRKVRVVLYYPRQAFGVETRFE